MSYVKRHSSKFAEKKRQRMITLLFLAALCLVTIAAASILFLRSSFLQIERVVVEGAVLAPKESVEAAALAALSGSYWNIIPFSNIIFFPKSAIRDTFRENFKEVETFSVDRKGFSVLQINLWEKTPAAVACAGFRDESEESDCYWVDARGYVFGQIASSTGAALAQSYNHYYLPTDKGGIKPGTSFVGEKRFEELQRFIGGASRGGLFPLGVLVNEAGEYEMYVKNKKGDSEVTIYFDDRFPFAATLSNLLAFWQNPFGGTKGTTTPAFDYINLRFGNTVYYSTQ